MKPGEGALKLANIEVNVDPIAEWKQMYHEVWRIERSYFYDPNLHGVNTADSEKEYEKYLDSLSSRADLNYIFNDMLSEMTSGHLRGGGGNIPLAKTMPGGLLGADYEIANGRYRFKKIYVGESWNPQVQAPLAQPGLNVNEGDYLLAVNGQDLAGKDDVSRLLENTAGKPRDPQDRAPMPPGAGRARDHGGADRQRTAAAPCGVDRGQPAQGGSALRRQARLCLPAGYRRRAGSPTSIAITSRRRDKQGAVIDERFNSGGQVADYIIEAMQPPADGLLEPALRRDLPHAGGVDPGAEGDDHQ